jgi:hypothetical protein
VQLLDQDAGEAAVAGPLHPVDVALDQGVEPVAGGGARQRIGLELLSRGGEFRLAGA